MARAGGRPPPTTSSTSMRSASSTRERASEVCAVARSSCSFRRDNDSSSTRRPFDSTRLNRRLCASIAASDAATLSRNDSSREVRFSFALSAAADCAPDSDRRYWRVMALAIRAALVGVSAVKPISITKVWFSRPT